MEVQASSKFNIIGEDLRFRESGLSNFLSLREHELIISIIGTQSSGKSSLLNELSGLELFKTMNPLEGYSQTTLGIDIAFYREFLLLDCEGSDSSERLENDQISVQYKLSLLTLMMSDIMMVNIMSNEINIANSNFKILLKVVFEGYLKHYSAERKSLYIILRDCPFNINEEEMKRRSIQVLRQIWESMNPQIQDIETCFDIKVFCLHYNNCLLANEVQAIREQVFSNSNGSIETAQLPQLFRELWEKIDADEDINGIRSVKSMMDDNKCKNIMRRCLEARNSRIQELMITASNQLINLEQSQSALIQSLRDEAVSRTSSIPRDIRETNLAILRTEIENRFSQIRRVQVEFRTSEIRRMCSYIDRCLSNRNYEVSGTLNAFAENLRNSSIENYSEVLSVLSSSVASSVSRLLGNLKLEISHDLNLITALDSNGLSQLSAVETKLNSFEQEFLTLTRNLHGFVRQEQFDFSESRELIVQKRNNISAEIERQRRIQEARRAEIERQRAQEARNRQERERKRAEEARKKAEEDRRRADEARKKAEEDRKRAEEERKRREAEAKRKAEAERKRIEKEREQENKRKREEKMLRRKKRGLLKSKGELKQKRKRSELWKGIEPFISR